MIHPDLNRDNIVSVWCSFNAIDTRCHDALDYDYNDH